MNILYGGTMGIEEDKLDILIRRLRRFNYDIDTAERNHLLSLIRRGVVKIDIAKDFLDKPEDNPSDPQVQPY